MRAIWFCGRFNVPEGATLDACQPGNSHDDWRCGYAYEGSATFIEALDRYGHAIRKPKVWSL